MLNDIRESNIRGAVILDWEKNGGRIFSHNPVLRVPRGRFDEAVRNLTLGGPNGEKDGDYFNPDGTFYCLAYALTIKSEDRDNILLERG